MLFHTDWLVVLVEEPEEPHRHQWTTDSQKQDKLNLVSHLFTFVSPIQFGAQEQGAGHSMFNLTVLSICLWDTHM